MFHPDTAEAVPEASFRQSTVDVVTRLRSALLQAIGFPTSGIQKSRDLQNRLGVSLNLSWQLYRMANSADALEACAHIPTRAPMRNLLMAIKKHNGVAADITAAEAAYADFEAHVATHAGDRVRFDVMVSQVAGMKAGTQVEFNHRRSVFDAYRYFIGVEIETFILADILHPSLSRPGELDQAYLRMRNNLRRLNSEVALKIDARKYAPGSGGTDPVAIEALDSAAFERYQIPVLPAFCSRTDLPLRQYEAPPGNIVTEWMGESFGKLGGVDVAFGEVRRNVPMKELPDKKIRCTTAIVFPTPVRTLIRDMFVHRSTLGAATTELEVREGVTAPLDLGAVDYLNLTRIPCREQVSFMGGGESAAYTPEVPNYVSMLRYACAKLGWKLEEFDVYRIRMEYPLIHSMLSASYTFAGRP